MSLDKFKLSDHVKTGIWFEFDENVKFKLAHSGRLNTKAQAIWERLHKPYRHQIRTGTLSDDKSDELLIQFLAEAIILDWKIVKDGSEIAFTRENVTQFLKDYPYLKDHVTTLAADAQNYLETSVKEDVGN